MSLYNLVNGVHPTAGNVLEFLGLDVEDCGRFRDAFITRDGWLAIYTRCGAGNRKDYQDMYERLRSHPNYAYDEDDDFDTTYSTIFFTVPDANRDEVYEYLHLVKESGNEELFWTPEQRFQHAIDTLKREVKC